MLKINETNTRMKQTNNVILTKSVIIVDSALLIIYFNYIINLKHIYIYIQTENVNNKQNNNITKQTI